ncbi:MAG: hypothetical protein G01um1014107_73 [Parcubacteria group bacterium Gr01-1014_107]|nr:MAG: hypothetical protein G01um1014107_73 [Parcubacteria group bacterium Gr01-1014_107]
MSISLLGFIAILIWVTLLGFFVWGLYLLIRRVLASDNKDKEDHDWE